MKDYIKYIKDLSSETKRKSCFIFFTYFFALFSYPLVRSATGAYFYESYTSQEYSFATFVAIVFLAIVIWMSNIIQKKIGIHKLYLYISFLTSLFLLIAYTLHGQGLKPFAFVLFAIKESYIVLLIHLCLAFANGAYSLKEVKKLFGPLGAIGSIGGIIGGQLTKGLATNYGTEAVFFISLFLIPMAGIIFYQTRKIPSADNIKESTKDESPIKAVRSIRSFVVLIGLIVALSQWVIFVADLQFNVIFEQTVTTKNERTSYLGNLYSYINAVSLIIQFILIPYLFSRVSNRKIFFMIPIFYLVLTLGVISLGAGSIAVAGGIFILLKASDYSIFAYSKEVLYHGLTRTQKFGAKYITDMFVYRLSKALIAFVMSFVLIKELAFLNILQIIFIFVWLLCVYTLLKKQKED